MKSYFFMNRIGYLDGHRGIAIILVVLYHSYSRWTDYLPFATEFAEITLFKYGFIGVNLFFIISGFVIFMTLERCHNFQEFIFKRWLRLFPAMLICSAFIYFTSSYFYERPLGQPSVLDLLPGLIFLEPKYLSLLTGEVFRSIEGTFWSLYVEFKFYVIAATLYYILGSRYLVQALFLMFCLWFSLEITSVYISDSLLVLMLKITQSLSFQYFGWFSAGASFYLYTKGNNEKWFVFGVGICILSSLGISLERNNLYVFFAALLISVFFILTLRSEKLQLIISNKILLFFGAISYPLYLLHENMIISITIKLNNYYPSAASFFLPLISLLFVSILSLIVIKYLEFPIRNFLLFSGRKSVTLFKRSYSN